VLLLETGEIMAEDGFRAINNSRIAAHVNMHRKNISNNFGSLNGLLAAYIKRKDYWNQVFERYVLPATATDDDVQEMFIDLMQANFNFFAKDREMQQVILWQISETNALMQSVSEKREKSGAVLLGYTDRHFEGWDIGFRVITALILGGIYYLVLHARFNKSTVAGIDMNNEWDRQRVLKAIRYLIELVWWDAGRWKWKEAA
jgi:AcrR family transcriptional regulator